MYKNEKTINGIKGLFIKFDEYEIINQKIIKSIANYKIDTHALEKPKLPENLGDAFSIEDELKKDMLLYYSNEMGHLSKLKESCNYFMSPAGREHLTLQIRTLSYDFAVAYLGLCKEGRLIPMNKDPHGLHYNSPIFINKDLDRERDIHLIVPMVPVKSIFTINILSTINYILQILHKNKINVSIEIWESSIPYKKVMSEIYPLHSSFNPDLKNPENIKALIELEFLAFVNKMLLISHWENGEDADFALRQKKICIVRQMKYVNESGLSSISDKLRDKEKRINEALSAAGHKLETEWKIALTSGFESYIFGNEVDNLITKFTKALMERVTYDYKDKNCIILLPYLDAILLSHLLEYVYVKKWQDIVKADISNRIFIVAYTPFPLYPELIEYLPFYFFPYSGLLYDTELKSKKEPKYEIIMKFIFKVMDASLRRYRLHPLEEVSFVNYKQMFDYLMNIFRTQEDEMDKHLSYIF